MFFKALTTISFVVLNLSASLLWRLTAVTTFFFENREFVPESVCYFVNPFAAFMFLLSYNFSDFEGTKIMCHCVHHQEKTTFNENSELNQKSTPNRFSFRSASTRTCKKNFDMSFLRCWKNTNVESSRARQNQHLFSDLQFGLLCRKVKAGDNTNLSKDSLEQEKNFASGNAVVALASIFGDFLYQPRSTFSCTT